jgi:hypothetical protein
MKTAFSTIMNLKSPVLFTVFLILVHSRGFADELRESYLARLSARDHFSSRGQRLDTAAAVIRQDRANYYVYNIRDDEDEPDTFFASKANRERLEQLLEHGTSNRNAVRRILNGTPLIKVQVYTTSGGRDYINVTVVSD